MKKVILTSVMAVAAVTSLNAQAATGTATVCAGGSASSLNITSDTNTFIRSSFAAKCSNNVHLIANDQQTYFGAGSASVKGKTIFFGSTAGGAVVRQGDCAATGCTSANAVTAAEAAPSS